MGEIVNLRKVRKARARTEDAAKAAENRVRHGRSAAERAREKLEQEQARRRVEGARQEGSTAGERGQGPHPGPLPEGEGEDDAEERV